MARPVVHTAEVYAEILERMEAGEFLSVIACEPGMPKASTVRKHAEADAAFGALYARAREMQAHAHAEMAVIAARTVTRPEEAGLARLRYDAERWMAGKLRPKVYGDKIEHEIGGDLNIRRVISEKPMTEAEWNATHADKDGK